MNTPLERLLSSLPQKKLSRTADLKIRFRLLRIQLMQVWQTADFSLSKGWQAGLAAVLVLLVGLSGTGVYAYSSDKVNRQSRLYPIKRTLEKIEQTATKDPAARTSLETKLATRRLAEARTLIDDTDNLDGISDALDLTLGEARRNIESANEDLESIESANDREQAARRLDEENQKHAQSLEQIAGKLSLDNDETIVDTVAATLENLERQGKLLRNRPDEKRASKRGGQPTSMPASEPRPGLEPATTSPAISSSSEETKKSEDLESFRLLKKRVEAFKKEQEDKLKQEPNPKAEKFIKNLEKKIDRAESSIKQGDQENFIKLYQATTALTNTADHFISTSTSKELRQKAGSEKEKKRAPQNKEAAQEKQERSTEKPANKRLEGRNKEAKEKD